MQLDRITANIRLRHSWEAFDLGLNMVQAWWKSIYFPWLILVIITTFAIWILVPEEELWVAPFVFWWLKPFYDRFLLYIVSHRLFGDEKTATETFKAIPFLFKSTGLFSALTFRRLSLSRGLNIPIWQLEQLRGSARSKRQSLIHGAIHTNVVFYMMAMVHFEWILTISIYGLAIMFIPPEILTNMFDRVQDNIFNFAHFIDQFTLFIYAFVVFILEPIYVAGTFCLYLNRRTELEAWDIELNFRQMAERLNTSAKRKTSQSAMLGILLIVGGITLTMPLQPIQAEPVKMTEEYLASETLPANESKRVIDEILEGDEFSKTETETVWRFKNSEDDETIDDFDIPNFDLGFLNVIAFIIKVLLVVALIAAIIYVVIHREKWLSAFRAAKQEDEYQAPDILFGMDIRPESLPDNIPEEAKKRWDAGNKREALSLLYRGALMRLVKHEDVPLDSSHTEGDVLRIATPRLQLSQNQYLKLLTKTWQELAYAHRQPEEKSMQILLQHWQAHFVAPQVEATPASESKV
jgi:hypothetical protein